MDSVWLFSSERESRGPTKPCAPFLHARCLQGLLVCLVLVIASIDNAEAQQVVFGVVSEVASGEPVEGAMVVLLAGDQVVVRTLSTASGSFTMSVPQPGRYELRVDRIGYTSTFSGAFDVVLGAMVERKIETAVRPIALRGLDVSGARRCDQRSGDGLATATVWEEVRKALAAATWTSERELYRFAWVRYVRELDSGGERIVSERRARRRIFTPQPFVSVDLDSLAAYGYVREQGDQVLYSAPDATVLLSESFLETHCFSLERKTEDGGRFIGLRFEPVEGRRLPEVAGVLWLDEENGRLASLDYEYVNLGRRAPVRGDDASGRMLFRELPNGTWIVTEWSIRMPQLVEVRDGFGQPRHYDVLGYVEEGGSVTRVMTSAGVVLNESRSGIIGSVTDSVGLPAEGARVWVVGTDLETLTDSEGAFSLLDMGPGTWRLRATHPSLTQFGYPGGGADVTVERDEVRPVRLGLPSIGSVVSERCGRSASTDGRTAILVGRVIDSSGESAPNAAVRVVWNSFRTGFEGYATAADDRGAFVLCDVPVGRSLVATASASDQESGRAEVRVPERTTVVSVEIALERPIDVEAPITHEARLYRTEEEAAWLMSVGFDLREDQALVHLTNREIIGLGHAGLRVLREIPRLEVRPRAGGGTEFRLHPNAQWSRSPNADDGCELVFYLNGSLVRQRLGPRSETSIDRWLAPRQVTAIEVFDGPSVPVGPQASCGAVVIWAMSLRHPEDPGFTGNLRGRVVGLDGILPDSVELRLRPGGNEARLDDQGRFDFGSLPPALYFLDTSIPAWGTWSMRVELRAYATADVVIEVYPRQLPDGR